MSYKKQIEDHEVTLNGVKLIIRKGVFSPTNSTKLVLDNIPNMKNKVVLDVGSGSGVLGIYCALSGAKKIVSVDNDEKVVQNTKENVDRNDCKNIFSVIKSDLFENVSGKFDFIFGNLPTSNRSWNLEGTTQDLMKTFIVECPKYLKKNGRVYFTWNSNENVDEIKDFLSNSKFNFKITDERVSGRTWYLFELKLK